MQNVLIEFLYQINDAIFRVQCPPNTPLDSAKEMIEKFKETIDEMEKQAKIQNLPNEDNSVEQKEGE